jgi:hypothetical protein
MLNQVWNTTTDPADSNPTDLAMEFKVLLTAYILVLISSEHDCAKMTLSSMLAAPKPPLDPIVDTIATGIKIRGTETVAKIKPENATNNPKKTSIFFRPIRSAMNPATVLKRVEKSCPAVSITPIIQRGTPTRLMYTAKKMET